MATQIDTSSGSRPRRGRPHPPMMGNQSGVLPSRHIPYSLVDPFILIHEGRRRHHPSVGGRGLISRARNRGSSTTRAAQGGKVTIQFRLDSTAWFTCLKESELRRQSKVRRKRGQIAVLGAWGVCWPSTQLSLERASCSHGREAVRRADGLQRTVRRLVKPPMPALASLKLNARGAGAGTRRPQIAHDLLRMKRAWDDRFGAAELDTLVAGRSASRLRTGAHAAEQDRDDRQVHLVHEAGA